MPKKAISMIAMFAILLSGCAVREELSNEIDVIATDTGCKLATASVNAGVVAFNVTNNGEKVTEFYVLEEDQTTVVSEAENIGPGISRTLIVELPNAGKYFVACVPGMVGDGFLSDLEVTGTAEAREVDQRIMDAEKLYLEFVKSEVELLVKETQAFADLYVNGNDDSAREKYPFARMHWERIEPVAESFGDLDPILDAREADLLEGEIWAGWHKLEKDLWPPADSYVALTQDQRAEFASKLVEDTLLLQSSVATLDFKAFQMSNGAKELLDEVVTGKLTGEEEIWSGTDLWDFQANVEGSYKVFTLLSEVITERDNDLAKTLEAAYTGVFSELEKYKKGEGYIFYSELSPAQIKELGAVVDALAEPLSRMTAVVTR